MILDLIQDQLHDATFDSISVSTLFLVAVISIQSIKLMNNSARERQRDFNNSPELKEARREFNKRQRAERDPNSFSAWKKNGGKFKESDTDKYETLGMSRAAKKNYYANKELKETRAKSSSSIESSTKTRPDSAYTFGSIRESRVSGRTTFNAYSDPKL